MSKAIRTYLGLYCALLVSVGSLYAISCAPGLLWQDSGVIQYRLWRGDIEGALGLALSHPLFYILGIGIKCVPFAEVSYQANLISSLAGTIAIANIGLLLYLYSGRIYTAIIGALTLAVSHTFWWHASVAETYTLWAALFTGELIALLQYDRTGRERYLYLLAGLNGMAVAVHMMACIPFICYVVMMALLAIQKKVHTKVVMLMMVIWIIGVMPYAYLMIQRIIETGQVRDTLASMAFGQRWAGDVLNVRLSWAMVRENGLLMLLNCPSPNVLLFFVGFTALWKSRAKGLWPRVVLVTMILFFLFAFRYTVSDRYAFFIPFYITAAVCIGLGAHRLLEQTQKKWVVVLIGCFALLPIGVDTVAPKIAREMDMSLGTRGDVPYRDDYTYFLQPWKRGYRGADRFANEVLESVAIDAIIYADTTTVGPLLYTQEVHEKRRDVEIITGIVNRQDTPAYNAVTFERLIESRPTYVTSNRPGYCPPFILNGPYRLIRNGLLWKVSKT